jgi:uncharacterized protein YutE (UPF0331/DUF86 family)
MDRAVIESKLESLRRCLERLRARTPESAAALAADQDLQDIIALNLVRAVQVATDIAAHLVAAHGLPAPSTMAKPSCCLQSMGLPTVVPPSGCVPRSASGASRSTTTNASVGR